MAQQQQWRLRIVGTVLISLALSVFITFVASLWAWLENPEQLFHHQQGTNWQFVYDTALSWFIPSFWQLTLLFLALQWWLIKKQTSD